MPDDLPWRDVLQVAARYLGTMHSAAGDWDPLTQPQRPVRRRSPTMPTVSIATDPWQFTNFLVADWRSRVDNARRSRADWWAMSAARSLLLLM